MLIVLSQVEYVEMEKIVKKISLQLLLLFSNGDIMHGLHISGSLIVIQIIKNK